MKLLTQALGNNTEPINKVVVLYVVIWMELSFVKKNCQYTNLNLDH